MRGPRPYRCHKSGGAETPTLWTDRCRHAAESMAMKGRQVCQCRGKGRKPYRRSSWRVPVGSQSVPHGQSRRRGPVPHDCPVVFRPRRARERVQVVPRGRPAPKAAPPYEKDGGRTILPAFVGSRSDCALPEYPKNRR